jgi:hypothetical protein
VDTAIAALDEIFTEHVATQAAAVESETQAAAQSIGGLYNG